MKNLTIALNDDLHHQSRVRAARAGLSMSRYIARLVEEDVNSEPADDETERQKRLDALRRVFDAPKMKISENGRMPTSEERNARR